MDNILNDNLNFCKTFFENKKHILNKKIMEISHVIEESFVFERQYRLNDRYKLKQNISIIQSLLMFQNIILDEINKIKCFKYIQSDPDKLLSAYGSFYCGDGILYYSDVLVSYSNEQFLQIILNHILHYLHCSFKLNKHNNSIKSLILLSFYHLRLFDFRIKYSSNLRYKLYDDKLYKKIIDDFIIFNPSLHLESYIIKNNIKTDYFNVVDNYINGIEIYIMESDILFMSYTTGLYNIDVYNVFDLDKKYRQMIKTNDILNMHNLI